MVQQVSENAKKANESLLNANRRRLRDALFRRRARALPAPETASVGGTQIQDINDVLEVLVVDENLQVIGASVDENLQVIGAAVGDTQIQDADGNTQIQDTDDNTQIQDAGDDTQIQDAAIDDTQDTDDEEDLIDFGQEVDLEIRIEGERPQFQPFVMGMLQRDVRENPEYQQGRRNGQNEQRNAGREQRRDGVIFRLSKENVISHADVVCSIEGRGRME